MTEDVSAPSREQFRERRRQRHLERRRAWVGVPLVAVGLALIGAGVYVWVDNNRTPGDPGVRVGGEVIERTTTSGAVPESTTTVATTTTIVAVELAPAVTALNPDPGGATTPTTAPG